MPAGAVGYFVAGGAASAVTVRGLVGYAHVRLGFDDHPRHAVSLLIGHNQQLSQQIAGRLYCVAAQVKFIIQLHRLIRSPFRRLQEELATITLNFTNKVEFRKNSCLFVLIRG